MNITEIKKELYRRKPTARLERIIKGSAIYRTDITWPYPDDLCFNVPIDDVGDAVLYPEMEAQLLIRYLSLETENAAGKEGGE